MMNDVTNKNKKPHKFQLLDKVRHINNPDLIYIVGTIYKNGTYKIFPLNADIDKSINFATDDCMSLYDR